MRKFRSEEGFAEYKDAVFMGNPNFTKALDKVFMGYSDAVMLIVPEWTRTYYILREHVIGDKEVVYLSKDMIKIKKTIYKINKRKDVYPYREDVYCIRFFPILDLAKYTKYFSKKYGREWNTLSYSRTAWDVVTHPIQRIINRYLRYYGYKHLADEIYLNVIPMAGESGMVHPMEPFKKAWRQPTFRGVLEEVKLPATRSMIRILASRIIKAQQPNDVKHYFNELPMLGHAKTVWTLTKDLEMTRNALRGNEDGNDYGTHYIGQTRDINKLLIKGNKNRAKNIVKDMMAGDSWRISDIMSMWKDIKREHGIEPVLRSNNMRDVHNELRTLSEKIRNAAWEETLEYEDNLKEIDGLEFCIINNKKHYKVILPKKANDLLVWGNHMNHCIGGASYRRKLADGTHRIVGITDEKDKLLYAITTSNQYKDIVQFKGWSNCYPLAVEYDVACQILAQAEILDLDRSQHDEDPRKASRLKRRADILGYKYEGGDEEAALVPANNRNPYAEIIDGANMAQAADALDAEIEAVVELDEVVLAPVINK